MKNYYVNTKPFLVGVGTILLIIFSSGCKYTSKKETASNDTIVKKVVSIKENRDYLDSVYKSLKGKVAPDWKMLNGTTKPIECFKDSVVLIEFTDPGCHVCKTAKKYIDEIKESNKNKNFKLCVIDIDRTIGILNGSKPKSMVITDGVIDGKDIVRKYGVIVSPTFFLLDKNGIIIYMKDGFYEEACKEMSDLIEQEL